MKAINLSEIRIGTITDKIYYSANGEVLIGKGVVVTERHINVLKRRNIFEVFEKKSSNEVDELEKILSKKYDNLGDLDIFNDSKIPAPLEEDTEKRPGGLTLPTLRDIKPGVEGFKQLQTSKAATSLDKNIKAGHTSDKPMGPPLKLRMKEKTPEERTEEYKKEKHRLYKNALNRVSAILNDIAEGNHIDGNKIRRVVKEFVATFVTDKNILLNLSNIRAKNSSYFYHHVLNVSLLSINIATASGYNEDQVVEIGMGALLYDVGMLLVPKNIIHKKNKLNRDEWYEIHKHPIMGLHLLENVKNLPESIKYIAYQSHEREDGQGYPKKRNKHLIHRFAKIIRIADIFVALSSKRAYRDESLPFKAMESILNMVRQGVVSRDFVKDFLSYTSLFPVGSFVELNDHRIGKVIQANADFFDKPVVSILTDIKGGLLNKKDVYQIDLTELEDTHIIKAISPDEISDVQLMDGF